MTKKLVIGVLLLAAAVGASVYVYQKMQVVSIPVLESVVPGDGLIYYLKTYDLDSKIKEFQAGQFFQQVSDTRIYKEKIDPELKKIGKTFPFLADLAGMDTGLAIFSLGKAGSIEDFLIATRLQIKKLSVIRKQLDDFYLANIAKEDLKFSTYEGVKITSFKFPQEDGTFYSAMFADMFLAGNNQEQIKKSIDLFRKKSARSLNDDQYFQKSAGGFKKDMLLWGYQNNANYIKEMERQYESLASEPAGEPKRSARYMNAMKPLSNMTAAFQESSFYAEYYGAKEGIVFKSYVTFDRTKDQFGLLDAVASGRPMDKGAFNLVPKDIIGFYEGSLSVAKYWDFLKKFLTVMTQAAKESMPGGPQRARVSFDMGDPVKQLNAFLGVDIEKDVLPLLDDSLGLIFVNIDEVELAGKPQPQGAVRQPGRMGNMPQMDIPFPRLYGFCQVKDSKKMQDVMQNMTTNLVVKINDLMKARKKLMQQSQAKLKSSAAEPVRNNPAPAKEAVVSGRQTLEPAGQPIEEKDALVLKEESYKGTVIHYLEIEDIPVKSFRPAYAVLDKYFVITLSDQILKNVIDVYKGSLESVNDNLDFKAVQKRLSADYSSMLYFDLRSLISNITRLKAFGMFQLMAGGNAKGPGQYLQEILGILDNISGVTAVTRLSGPDTMESESYIEIKGL